MKDYKNINMTFGIDSLYYFCATNDEYDDLYLDIIDQMEIIKGKFALNEISYKPKNISVDISDTNLTYLGFSEGYIWFRDINNFFKIGFKDYTKNRGLHNIRVQLLGEGIYTIGITSLISYIDNMLKNYILDKHPVTRADLNCFIEYDFSWITKNMFVTKKRAYSVITEIGNADKIQTLYVGKNPFKLRLYNKTVELKKPKKQNLMNEFFLNNGFNIKNTIFNIEFEMHRSHLKAYNIDTAEDVLANANNLFKQSMEDIRLIDTSKVKSSENKNKYRAVTLPIWEYIKNSFDIKEFLQIDTPLERIKRAIYVYDYHKFKDECISLIRKARLNSVVVSLEELKDCLDAYVETLEVRKPHEKDNDYIVSTVEVIHKDKPKEKFRLLKNGELIKPVNIISVATLSNSQLLNYLDDLTSANGMSEDNNYRYEIAYNELVKRGLKEPIPF